MSLSFERIQRDHPIAARLFVFLRHQCNPDWMDESGFVAISIVSRELGHSVQEIIDSVEQFNKCRRAHQQMTIDDDGYGVPVIKANTCHSIAKVRNLPRFKSNSFPYPPGYIFLHHQDDLMRRYNPDDDVLPVSQRNDVIVRFIRRDMIPWTSHLVIDLWKLSRITDIYQFDSTGVLVRGKIPADCITFVEKQKKAKESIKTS